MSDYTLIPTAETSIKTLVDSLVSGLDPVPRTAKGQDIQDSDQDDALNGVIICSAEGTGDEEVHATGNFWLQCMIEIAHGMVPSETGGSDDPRTHANQILTAVSNGVIVDDLADLLSTTDFTVYARSIVFESPTRETDENGFWRAAIKWKMLCCAATI